MYDLTAVVIDDEPKSRQVIIALLDMFAPNIEIVGEAGNIPEAVRLINTIRPQLVFFDILLQDGDSFEIIKQLEEVDFDMIFVTAFDEDSVKALKFSGAKVLLKPIQIEELIEAVEQVEPQKGKSYLSYQMADGMLRNKLKSIPIITAEGLKFKPVNEILFVEARESGCVIHFHDGLQSDSEKSVAEFMNFLSDRDFELVNPRILVNLNYLSSSGRSKSLLFKNGREVNI